MDSMLQCKNLTKHFGGLVAVDDVSIEIFPGEVVGLVGDNGAGKSTLIKMISGVYQPNDGEIYFDGRPAFLVLHGAARRSSSKRSARSPPSLSSSRWSTSTKA